MAEKRANGTSTKKWNAGAPLSKKSKGLGAHKLKGENGRYVANGDKPRDESLPTSVPMPSAVETTSPTMACGPCGRRMSRVRRIQ